MDKISEFSQNLKKALKVYSSFSLLPVEGLNWEYICYISAKLVYDDCIWENGSHKEGSDIEIISGQKKTRLSLKTNRIKSKTACISSYRTTKYEKLEDKLKYIKEINNSFDFYLLLLKKYNNSYLSYSSYLIPSETFSCYERENWMETKTFWKFENQFFKAKITKNMSDQLWYYFNEEFIRNYKMFDLEIYKEDMGRKFLKEMKTTEIHF